MSRGRSTREAVFREWLARTGDVRVAAERAGVSERTARRWRGTLGDAARVGSPTEPPPSARSAPAILGAPRSLVGQPTRFFGRRDGALRKAFADGARLVTLLGPAGIGKTRLALRYAELAEGAYDAVFFCDLSEATTALETCAVVARVLGIDGRSDATAIGWALDARGRVLVILDNFEGAAAAAPETVGAWSATARRAHVIATSRVQLRVVGEACIVLEPLALPERDAPDPMAADALQLLADRARLAGSDVAWSAADVSAAAEIVRKLDGNALAIELAAARLALLSPEKLLARLAKRFDVLVGGARDAPHRQASMRVALDGSWELLADDERALLADIGVFAGAFTLEAAEAVAEGEVLTVLERLRQASLVHTRKMALGDVRFGLYETIRDYAREKAEALGRAAPARARHRAYFAEVARARMAELEGADAARARAEILLDHDDLLAALRQALAEASGDGERARRDAFAIASCAPALFGGRARREVELFDEVLVAFGRDVADEAQLAVQCLRADASRRAGDPEASARELDAVGRAARACGAHRIEALAELGLGNARHAGGRSDDAVAHLDRALALARELGDRRLEGRVLARKAMALRLRQDTSAALAAAEEALAIFERAGSKHELADVLGTLATLHQRTGELGRARARYEAALALVDDADPNVAGPFHGNLGTFYNQLGELDEARKSFERSLGIFARAGIRRLEAVSLGNLASVDFETGRLDEARQKLERCVRVLHQVGDATHEVFFNGQLAAVLATMGAREDAEALLRRADAAPERTRWADALALQRGFVELARASASEAAGDGTRAAELRASVRARIASAPADAVDDVKVAVRMLVRALDRPSRAKLAAPELGALTATADAATVWLPTTEKVSLEKRGPVRLVLLRLIEEHRRGGKALGVDELLAAGWPGERVLRDAGASRVYVALGTLRKLGLRDVIQSRDGGYAIDPALRVVVLET